jgi:hypothetical protein
MPVSKIGLQMTMILFGTMKGSLVGTSTTTYLMQKRLYFHSDSDPNGAKIQLLMHTNTNLLLDLCILLGLFDRGYQLMA